jgi:hypothetical protein
MLLGLISWAKAGKQAGRHRILSGVESKPASKDRIKTSQSEAWYSYWFAGVHTSGFIAN